MDAPITGKAKEEAVKIPLNPAVGSNSEKEEMKAAQSKAPQLIVGVEGDLKKESVQSDQTGEKKLESKDSRSMDNPIKVDIAPPVAKAPLNTTVALAAMSEKEVVEAAKRESVQPDQTGKGLKEEIVPTAKVPLNPLVANEKEVVKAGESKAPELIVKVAGVSDVKKESDEHSKTEKGKEIQDSRSMKEQVLANSEKEVVKAGETKAPESIVKVAGISDVKKESDEHSKTEKGKEIQDSRSNQEEVLANSEKEVVKAGESKAAELNFKEGGVSDVKKESNEPSKTEKGTETQDSRSMKEVVTAAEDKGSGLMKEETQLNPAVGLVVNDREEEVKAQDKAPELIVEVEGDGGEKNESDERSQTGKDTNEKLEAVIEKGEENKAWDEIVPADSEPEIAVVGEETGETLKEKAGSETEESVVAKARQKNGSLISKLRQSIVKVKRVFGGKSKASNTVTV